MHSDKKLVDVTRREVLKMAATLGSAALLTGLGSTLDPVLAVVANLQRPNPKKPAASAKVDPIANDLAILNVAINLEQRAVNTYLGMEKEKLILNKQILDVARQFAADHLTHRDELIKVVTTEFNATPANIKGLGTFPIPASILKKEVDAVRYALALEVIASKVYYDNFKDKLRTAASRDLFINILPVETQHVGVFRAVLKRVLKDKQIPDNDRIVPYSSLDKYPAPSIPQGISWDFERLS